MPDTLAPHTRLSIIDEVPHPLIEIAENIADISGTWNPVEIYTADSDSINSERQKVFDAYDKGEEYNPTLTYSYANSLDLSKSREKLLEQMEKLKSCGTEKQKVNEGKTPKSRINKLFRTALYFKIKDDLATCDLVDGIKNKDEDTISRALHQKYPVLDASLLGLAESGLTQLTIYGDPDDQEEIEGKGFLTPEEYKWLRNKELTAQEQVEGIKWSLSKLGLLRSDENPQGYAVVSTDDATGIDVRDKSVNGPTVYLPTDRPKPMTADLFLPLMAHEIGKHARQSFNGVLLFLLGGGRLKIDNETLYEGDGLEGIGGELDTRLELYGQEKIAPRPYYIFAAQMAEEGKSFFEIFKDQVDKRTHVKLKIPLDTKLPDFSSLDSKTQSEIKRDSWKYTYRVLRGHIDMKNENGFANPKDLGYLRGYQMVRQLRENDLGFISEIGVMDSRILPLVAELHITEDMIPVKNKNLPKMYWEEVLKPQYLANKKA